MINVNSISYALFTTLSSDQTLVNSGFYTRFSHPLNEDDTLLPSIDVHFEDMPIEPLRLGSSTPWTADLEFGVYVRAGDVTNPQAAAFAMQTAIYPVLSAINSAHLLGGAVLHLKQIDVEPFQMPVDEQRLIQAYRIGLTYEQHA